MLWLNFPTRTNLEAGPRLKEIEESLIEVSVNDQQEKRDNIKKMLTEKNLK